MTENEIKRICEKYYIKNWSLNTETGLVDVNGNVDLYRNNLTELPLNFGDVSGHFWCNRNELTTLKGVPISVGGVFRCSYNRISTRHKLPNVGDRFLCDETMKWLF